MRYLTLEWFSQFSDNFRIVVHLDMRWPYSHQSTQFEVIHHTHTLFVWLSKYRQKSVKQLTQFPRVLLSAMVSPKYGTVLFNIHLCFPSSNLCWTCYFPQIILNDYTTLWLCCKLETWRQLCTRFFFISKPAAKSIFPGPNLPTRCGKNIIW